jgi:hypothetical protein
VLRHVHRSGPEKQKGVSRIFNVFETIRIFFLEFQVILDVDGCKSQHCAIVAVPRIMQH